LTVRVNVGPPTKTETGDSDEITGRGLSTAKLTAEEVPPPGTGFTTVTLAVPAVAVSAGVTGAVSCVADTTVVVRLAPFH
jgi:hypothetical protein